MRTWQTWPEEDQKAMTGVLFMHDRVPGYEWVWERFGFEYTVLDGLYAIARRRHGLPMGSHAQRIEQLANHLGVPVDGDYVKLIVDLRNNLLHEVRFGDQPPGFSGHGDVYALPYRLRDLNRRLIAGLLGWDAPFVHSEWWHVDSVWFDL